MTQADVSAQALKVLGSCEEAEAWMQTPALALDNQRPADLLTTEEGIKQVSEHLTRLEYGVYC
jgi:putative toxin-antitoxin system antitoxin component (TIGR02293 family)